MTVVEGWLAGWLLRVLCCVLGWAPWSRDAAGRAAT